MIKVKWDVEELVALIDIYRRSTGKDSSHIDEELSRLSLVLNHRATLLNITHDDKYRNLNGMKMMFQNIVYIASNGEQGMSAASASMRVVYDMLRGNPAVFEMILNDFHSHYGRI